MIKDLPDAGQLLVFFNFKDPELFNLALNVSRGKCTSRVYWPVPKLIAIRLLQKFCFASLSPEYFESDSGPIALLSGPYACNKHDDLRLLVYYRELI